MSLPGYLHAQMSMQNIWLAFGMICLSHTVSFVYNFILREEYLQNQDSETIGVLGRRVAVIVYTVIASMIILVNLSASRGRYPKK
jgi:hypothetical protein